MNTKIKKEIEFLKSLTTYYEDNQITAIKQRFIGPFVYTNLIPTKMIDNMKAAFETDIRVYKSFSLASFYARIGREIYSIRLVHTELDENDWDYKEYTNSKGYSREYLIGFKTKIEMNF